MNRDFPESPKPPSEMQTSILDALPAHIALIDSTGVILAVNESWRRFARANVLQGPDYGVGQNYIEICERAVGECSEEAAAAAAGIRRVLGGETRQFALEYPCHSPHERRWFRLMVTPLSEVMSAGAVVMHIDVTERKLADEAVQRSEQQYRDLVETSHDLIWTVDVEGRITYANQATRSIYGCEPEEMIGRLFQEFIVPERLPIDQANFDESIQSGREILDNETLIYRKDGSIITLYSNIRMIRDDAGRIIGSTGISRDITEKKRAEDALRVQAQMLDSIGQAAITTDLEGRIIYANHFAGELYGWKPSEMLGQKIFDAMVARPNKESASEILNRLAQGEHWHGEFSVQRLDGTVFPAMVTNSPLLDENGNLTGIIGISTDITERKRIEEDTQRSASRLAAIVEVQQTLAATDADIDQIITNVVEMVQQLIGADGAVFEMIDGDSLVYRAASGIATRQIGRRLGLASSFSGRTIHLNQALRCDDSETDPRVDRVVCRQVGVRSITAAAIRIDDGPIGVIKVVDSRPNRFSDLDSRTLEILAESLGAAIQRRRNAELLRASESQYRLLFADNPQPMWVYDLETFGFLAVNAVAVEHYGYTEAEFLTMNIRDIRPSEDVAEFEQYVQRPPGRRKRISHWRHQRKDASIIEVEVTSDNITFGGKTARLVLANDVTERMRAEREAARANRALAVLSQCNDALIRAESESHLLDAICRIAVETGGFCMAWVGYALDDDDKTIAPQAFAGVEDGYLSEIKLTWDKNQPIGRGPAGLTIRTGEVVCLPDFASEPGFIPWLMPAQSRGYRGVVSLPLRDAGQTFGVLLLYLPEVRPILSDEMNLLQELADNLAFGIVNLRERAERRRTHDAVMAMAHGISASTGTEFFEKLTLSIVEALSAQAGFIAQMTTSDQTMARTLCAVIGGKIAPNFDYAVPGTPCENLDKSDAIIIPRRAREHYPQELLMSELGAEAYVGVKLLNPAGESIGLMFVLFDQPLEHQDFVSSTLRIFASRAAAELERQKSDAKVMQQASLLDKAQDAILVRDLDDRITYWNKSAERLYGWTAGEALGRPVRDLLQHDAAVFAEAMEKLLAQGDWMGELALVSKTGSAIVIEASWTLVGDDAGQPRSVLAINTDITERKKLEAQSLRSQRMESIGTLAGGIAHDLNNVLTPITLAIELLKMDETNHGRLAILSTIEGSAQRGADMVRQVLSFARGVEGRRIEVQIKHLLRDVEKIANETFLKSIEVRTVIPRDLWTVTGDPTQLHQVLLNLCVNARDAMPRGGTMTLLAENLFIDEHFAGLVSEASPGPHISIEVEDTGEGMSPEVIDKIFEPFFTTKEVGKGTGLGLSTSLAIVKSHGGFIRVYSERGKGSRFKIYIPAQTESGAGVGIVEPTKLPRGKGELVLVVDDEAPVRWITQQTLESFGYRVELAANGTEAISIYAQRKNEIAVVLTDMMMPVMDGARTIQVLININPDVRVIAASGLSSNEMVVKATNNGVRYFLPKPYTAEVLLRTLRQVLDESR